MTHQTTNQPLSELIKSYIMGRRNDKDRPPNKKLLEKLKNKLTESEFEKIDKKIKEKTSFLGEQNRYEKLHYLAAKHGLDVQSIVEEYQQQLESFEDEEWEKKISNLLKGKPKKNGTGGINYKLIEKLKTVLSADKVAEIEKTIKSEIDFFVEQKKYEMINPQIKKHNLDVKDILDEYDALLKKIDTDHDFNTWLNERAGKAAGVSLATHVAKLTHSSVSGEASCFYDKSAVQNNTYLTTAHIYRPFIDGAYRTAEYIPIATLLQLKNKEGSLADQILSGDGSSLAPFVNNKEQLEDWVAGFKKAVDNPQKSSHYRAKQVYFPVAEKTYHLLSIVVSSSLCHEFFKRFEKYWDADSEEARGRKKNGKYSPNVCVSYPGKAVLQVTSRKNFKAHLNVSKLNSTRKGAIALLSCQPPVWGNRLQPPINKTSLFYSEVQYRCRDSVKKLQRLLLSVKTKKLSANNPRIHARLTALVDEIIEIVFQYARAIQNLKHLAGWSQEAQRLKRSHQLWLDPFREDAEFQQARASSDWSAEICVDFSLWMNKQLKHKQLTLGKPQEAFWQKNFKSRLREFNALMEVNK